MAPDLAEKGRCDAGARCGLDGLAGLVPVDVPLEERIAVVVELSAQLSSRDLSAVVTTGDLDVEGLRPELAVLDGAVVVDGHDLSPQDVVAVGDVRGDGDALGVTLVVEDSVGAPVAGLLLG